MFQICSCILASSFILDCYFAEYITFWWKTHTEKKRNACLQHTKKKKIKTALHDSFVIFPRFFIFVSSENPKSSTFTNQACWCNCFFGTFPKKKNSLNLFAMYKFQKEKQKTFSYFTLTKLKTRCWIQSETCPTDLKVQEQIKMFIQGLSCKFLREKTWSSIM